MYNQAMNLSYNSPWYTTNEPSAQLSKMISDYAPGDLNNVFLQQEDLPLLKVR